MHVGRVLQGHHIFALASVVTHIGNRCACIFEQPGSVGGIAPRASDNSGAVARPHLVFIVVDESVEGVLVDQAFFDQYRLQRLDPEGRIGRHRVAVRFVIVVVCHECQFRPTV